MKTYLFAFFALTSLAFVGFAAANEPKTGPIVLSQTYSSIYWSDGDSGKVGDVRFRLANIDVPETRSLKQRGGAAPPAPLLEAIQRFCLNGCLAFLWRLTV